MKLFFKMMNFDFLILRMEIQKNELSGLQIVFGKVGNDKDEWMFNKL
uniref:Uncharacterized protein n=1 Tax=viral metagenome TaxID=1070528 RepID=A0A6C0HRX1_9ZZZZ